MAYDKPIVSDTGGDDSQQRVTPAIAVNSIANVNVAWTFNVGETVNVMTEYNLIVTSK